MRENEVHRMRETERFTYFLQVVETVHLMNGSDASIGHVSKQIFHMKFIRWQDIE